MSVESGNASVGDKPKAVTARISSFDRPDFQKRPFLNGATHRCRASFTTGGMRFCERTVVFQKPQIGFWNGLREVLQKGL
jgi:hypothetical protein